MSFFDCLKKSVSEMGSSINAEIKKFRSKELLDAIVSGSAMIAFADGEVSAEEKQKLLGYIRNSEQLGVFDTDKVIEIFNKTTQRFEFDNSIAIGETLQKIAPFKNKPEAHLIVQVCVAIAKADGNFDTSERKAVQQICDALELDSKPFGILEK